MTHLCVGVCDVVAILLSSALVCGFGVGGLCGWIGKTLLYMVFWIMFSSFLYSSSCKLYVFSLLYRNLMAAYFVLRCVVGCVWDDSVCESGFPVY